MREQRTRKRASRLDDYQCDSDQAPAGASNKRSTAAHAGRRHGNNVALLSNKDKTEEQYQEAAAAVTRKRNKQIEDACLGRGSGGLVHFEPMPKPPSK
ncbi:hypothetical protein OEZ86_014667 [Tetradesmus obliquus]|nr:hypothetical protein OEZ86_014667 [Tetradesmus obliquus]